MLITLERGGGIAGDRNHQRLGPIDTDDIDTRDRGLLISQIKQINFFDLETDWPDPRRISDAMWHSVEVKDAGRQRTVKWTDGSKKPAALAEVAQLASQLGEWENVKQ